MSYSRRRVIRDAGLMSLAGVGGFSPFLTGCHSNSFADGIRIFFEGAWLFCAHPYDSNLMLAVTLNPIMPKANVPPVPIPPVPAPVKTDKAMDSDLNQPPDSMSHIFPYGIWDQQSDWDSWHQNTQLACAPCAPGKDGKGCSMPIPHRIYILGHWTQFSNVDELFIDADTRSRFTYYPNKDQIQPRTVNWETPELRVISLPMPSRIIPAGFRPKADVRDNSGNPILHHGQSSDAGVATTHIFDYPGAHSMLFVPRGGDAVEMDHGRDFRSDFHFHTVPQTKYVPPGHDVAMFCALAGLLGLSNDYQFKPDVGQTPVKGSSVPDSVEETELEIPSKNLTTFCNKDNKTINLATCGSGGIGSGSGH
jgi:hypothetical protein